MGMRIIKSGVAVIIAAIIAETFHFNTPFYACMTAFITMEKTLFTSLKLGRNRTVGTLIGAIIGGGLSVFFAGNALVAGIAVMLCIKICTKLNLHGSIFISGIVCIACILHVSEGVGIYYGWERSSQTFVGMLVSIVVNLILLPYYDIDRIKNLEETVIQGLTLDDSCVDSAFIQLENTIDLYKNEIMRDTKKKLVQHYDERLQLLKNAKLHHDISKTIQDKNILSYHQNAKQKILNTL